MEKHNERENIAKVCIVDKLANTDEYDFIFLTVQEEQLHQVLEDLKNNCSHSIVTMVNSLEDYFTWSTSMEKKEFYPHFQELVADGKEIFWTHS